MNKNNILIGAGVLVVALVITFFILSDFSFENENKAVAIVNGEEIILKDFNFLYDQVEQNYINQGQEAQLETPGFADQLEQQVLDQLISQTLLVQAAIEEGYSASQEEIDSQYQSIITQAGGEEALDSIYKELGLTEEFIKEDLEEQIIISSYVNDLTEGQIEEVTNQDALDYYNQISSNQEGLPEFSEVEEQIKQELTQQRQNEFVSTVINSLSESAEIEILL